MLTQNKSFLHYDLLFSNKNAFYVILFISNIEEILHDFSRFMQLG